MHRCPPLLLVHPRFLGRLTCASSDLDNCQESRTVGPGVAEVSARVHHRTVGAGPIRERGTVWCGCRAGAYGTRGWGAALSRLLGLGGYQTDRDLLD